MSSFVLVHGAWHGSWCWKRVRTGLQAQGHEVFTPTLTGLADRSHLLSRAVNLETHIQDVVNRDALGGTDGRRAVRPLVRRLCRLRRRGPDPGARPRSGVSGCLRARGRRKPDATPDRIAVPSISGRREEPGGGLEGTADPCGGIQRERPRSRVGGSAMHYATDRNDATTPQPYRRYPEDHERHVHPRDRIHRGFAFSAVLRESQGERVEDTNGAMRPRCHVGSPGGTYDAARRSTLELFDSARVALGASSATATR